MNRWKQDAIGRCRMEQEGTEGNKREQGKMGEQEEIEWNRRTQEETGGNRNEQERKEETGGNERT